MNRVINNLDIKTLKAQYLSSKPFPFIVIENFLNEGAAKEAAASFPTFNNAIAIGRSFSKLNENKKVQIIDSNLFPPIIKKLATELESGDFLSALQDITGIPGLIWDPTFAGGGMHQTAASGWLDVHVDFNIHRTLGVFRRLNLLLYLNPVWNDEWGGKLELWNKDVSICEHYIAPTFNKCVVFATNSTSFHGVSPVTCPVGVQRQSFAVYYYSHQPADNFSLNAHSTIFKARPNEHLKKYAMTSSELRKKLVTRLKSILRRD